MNVKQIPLSAKAFFASKFFYQNSKDVLLACSSEDEALRLHEQLLYFSKNKDDVVYFPSLDTLPYDRVLPSPAILAERANTLSTLASVARRENGRVILVTHSANLLPLLPPKKAFADYAIRLAKGQKHSAIELSKFLVDNGFNRSAVALNDGEFSIRGEIVDLVLTGGQSYRIHFAWDQIESIKKYDIDTQISNHEQEILDIAPVSEVALNHDTVKSFKSNYLKNFGVNHTKHPMYEAALQQRRFPGYEYLLPLFYGESLISLMDYLGDPNVIYDHLSMQAMIEHEQSYKDFYQTKLQSNKVNSASFYPILPPEQLCLSFSKVKDILSGEFHTLIEPSTDSEHSGISSIDLKGLIFEQAFEIIKKHKDKATVICYQSIASMERIRTILSTYDQQYNVVEHLHETKLGLINLAKIPLTTGFCVTNESLAGHGYLFISEQDLFGQKFSSNKSGSSKRRLKNILTELDNLQPGELVVHKDHGIGKFVGVETISVQSQPHDCLKILYSGDDRLFLPVENIELIKKYGSAEAELDRLGSVSWQKRKATIKNRIKNIAAQLLKTAAERKLTKAPPMELDLSQYENFCSKFYYTETPDQQSAIDDIEQDLCSSSLMDRLICGDVGFGKTEVAMRAAFMATHNKLNPEAQVAIIAPTTLLCKQHYARFQERFEGVHVVHLSRLVSTKEAKLAKEDISSGKARIIVGTHALLAKGMEFKNLALIIIDEEQHFGVAQKERLKELKSGVHVLSMSATPIPRTLQMSMVGLKELSLIATPPVDRLSVRTTVMPFDEVIIRDALLRENFRGGLSFYVAPRVKDLEEVAVLLQRIVPELKYKIAHGQMSATAVDEIMNDFCAGKFDILLSTTIVESGLDITNANTMIIHKADMLGLSQLYQLRGRVGRGKLRGYVYLTLAKNRQTTQSSMQRLEIMQNINSLGAGFAIANHDMDLRGFGNLVGDEQSGHVREVGAELYQEMLDEQLALLQNEVQSEENFIPSINLGLSVHIPDSYIQDASLRLGIYRRIGNLLSEDEVEMFQDEMVDRFGPIPIEFNNLLSIVKIKQICYKLGISSIDFGPQGFVIKFHKPETRIDNILAFIALHPRHAKLKPDNKLIFLKQLSKDNILVEAGKLLDLLNIN